MEKIKKIGIMILEWTFIIIGLGLALNLFVFTAGSILNIPEWTTFNLK